MMIHLWFFFFYNFYNFFFFYEQKQAAIIFSTRLVLEEAKPTPIVCFTNTEYIVIIIVTIVFLITIFPYQVVGIDYCESFVKAAQKIQQDGSYKTMLPDGKVIAVELPEGTNPSRVTRKQVSF